MRNNYGKCFEFGSVIQEQNLFIRFLFWSSGGPTVRGSETIYVILQKGIMGIIRMKYETLTSGSGDVV